MKKSKGILTPAEKEVVKRNRKIIILFIILLLSLAINALFIFDSQITLPKYKIVKIEENEIENMSDDRAADKSIPVSDNFEADETNITDSGKTSEELAIDITPSTHEGEETKETEITPSAKDRALTEAYENAEIVTVSPDEIYYVEIHKRDVTYHFELQQEELYFSSQIGTGWPVHCKFVKEKYDEFLEKLLSQELKHITMNSYSNEDGKIIDYRHEEYISVILNRGSYVIYPTDNWNSIIEYCEELNRIAREE